MNKYYATVKEVGCERKWCKKEKQMLNAKNGAFSGSTELERLHNKLENKPIKRKHFWWWYASHAAALSFKNNLEWRFWLTPIFAKISECNNTRRLDFYAYRLIHLQFSTTFPGIFPWSSCRAVTTAIRGNQDVQWMLTTNDIWSETSGFNLSSLRIFDGG